MSNLLHYLTVHAALDVCQQLIADAEITEEGRIKALFKGEKRINRDLIKIFNSSSLEEIYISILATSMLREGYLVIPLENGYVVVSPKQEEYQIHERQCTCPDYLNGNHNCKHIVLIDWNNKLKARIGKAKKEILTREY